MSALPHFDLAKPPTPDRLTRRQLQHMLHMAQAQLAALEQLAFTDPLTGLRNRRYFDERLQQEVSRCRRSPESMFSVLAVDLNNFKLVNDTLGHQAGDALLMEVASHLLNTLRGHDVVCRTGGNEFLVVLPDTGAGQAAAAVGRLARGFASLRVRGASKVGLAIGSASYPRHGADATTLVKVADEAMYEDKRRQRSTGLALSTEQAEDRA